MQPLKRHPRAREDTLKRGLLEETMARTAARAHTLMTMAFLQLTEARVLATELWSAVKTGLTLSMFSPMFALVFERTIAHNQLT